MQKYWAILLIFTATLFASTQACYRMPTQAENQEQQEAMLKKISTSVSLYTSDELAHWYLALNDLLLREMLAGDIVHELITCCKDGGRELAGVAFAPWCDMVSYIIWQEKQKYSAVDTILEDIEKHLPERMCRGCDKAEREFKTWIINNLPDMLTNDLVYDSITHCFSQHIISLMNVFNANLYRIDSASLGITIGAV